MIKIENVVLPSPDQWKAIIMGCRNPLNSWEKSDSEIKYENIRDNEGYFKIGDNDLSLMKRLSKAGTDHRKFMRMIPVFLDITAPTYWWAEFDTYKIATVRNSCSFMHKGVSTPFKIDDFSIKNKQIYNILRPLEEKEYKLTYSDFENNTKNDFQEALIWGQIIQALNKLRDLYIETKDDKIFQEIRCLLPSGYMQRSTILLNYEVLSNMYKSRCNHRLDEWKDFCKWIETLPYSEIITHKGE